MILGLEPGEYRLLQEGIGVVGFGVASGEDYDRGVAVLTLVSGVTTTRRRWRGGSAFRCRR